METDDVWRVKSFFCSAKLVIESFVNHKDLKHATILAAAESVRRRHKWRGKNPAVPGIRLHTYTAGENVLVIQIITNDRITPGQFRAFYLYLDSFCDKFAKALARRKLSGKRSISMSFNLATEIEFPRS